MNQDELKLQVAKEAAKLIETGMVLGLGTGSTANLFLDELKKRIDSEGLEVTGVCTSEATKNKATELGIQILDINDVDEIDIDIDGADEVDSDMNLIKGGGGALTREKIVAYMSKQFVVITDDSKFNDKVLGNFAVPVEVMQFSWTQTLKKLKALGANVSKRMNEDKPYVTDNNNFILDAKFEHIVKPAELEKIINNIPGVVENGIFRKDKVTKVLIGSAEGVRILE